MPRNLFVKACHLKLYTCENKNSGTVKSKNSSEQFNFLECANNF
jgi:hypothetical protein